MAHANFDKCVAFLSDIGLTVIVQPSATGFLPGVRLERGTILVDRRDDALIGNLLHDAGHVAVIPRLFWPYLMDDAASVQPAMSAYLDKHADAFCGPVEDSIARGILQSDESEAIAWSYAAAIAIGVDPSVLFHEGFGGNGDEVYFQLSHGQHPGIAGLRACGMTVKPGFQAVDPYPKMRRWLQG